MGEQSPAALVAAAAAGDEGAWNELVERFGGLLWSIARSYRLNAADAADVTQATWLRLLEHLGQIREPAQVGAWLATTARRECLRLLRSRGREVPGEAGEVEALDDPPETAALAAERDTLLWAALAELPPRCQRLLRVLMASPPPSYAEVAQALGMPIGSIGPTRARCLDCLRRRSARTGLTTAGTA
jgi:RNA polymerase sigma factor (sigma-70 family)